MPKILQFDLQKLPSCPVIVLIGRRRSGKSVNCMSILKYLGPKCKWGLAFVGSNASINDYATCMPSSFIYHELDLDLIQRVIDRQNEQSQGNRKPDKIFIIIDDLAYNSALFATKQIKQLFLNGRHLGITLIITLQYCLLLPPSARGNTDVVFCSQEKSVAYRRKLYENFSIVFRSFYEFDRTYRECTKDFETFVMLNCSGNSSDAISDNVFFYKSEFPLPRFTMNPGGSWWDLHRKRNDPSGSYGNAGKIKKITREQQQQMRDMGREKEEKRAMVEAPPTVLVIKKDEEDTKIRVEKPKRSRFSRSGRVSRFS